MKGFADSTKILTKGAVEGAGEFLSRICLPAAKEFGLLLKDHVKEWRNQNALRIIIEAENRAKRTHNNKEVHAPPRVVADIIDKGSWSDEEGIQVMWAGLLASACTETGDDDSNIIFSNILSQLTSAEAKFIKWMIENPVLEFTNEYFHKVYVPHKHSEQVLLKVMGLTSPDIMHGQFQHLKTLGLVDDIIVHADDFHEAHHCYVLIFGTALALRFYARCSGSAESIWHFYKLAKFYGTNQPIVINLCEVIQK